MNFLKKIKRTNIWNFIITYLVYPVYNIFWSYFLNIDAKILYWRWFAKKQRPYFKLNNNDKLVIKDNPDFIKFAKKIYEKASLHLPKTREIILSNKYEEELKKTNYSRSRAPYHYSLYNFLNDEDKKYIVAFALSEKMISTAAKHMGVFPILTRVDISHNIPRENSESRAAMLWHKDEFGFKSLDFFMTITDLTEENGPFYCVEKKIEAGVFKSFSKIRKEQGERGKVNFEIFNKKFKNYKIVDMIGSAGNAIFLDSFSTYHRGGECKSKDRIMLRFCYQTKDAICDDSFYKVTDEYKYDRSIKNNQSIDVFKKYLLFKKPSKGFRYLSALLLKFYYLISFKYEV